MKHMITAAALLTCLLLCSCGSKTENIPEPESTTAVTTTVSGSDPEPQDTQKSTDAEKPADAKETSAKKTTETTARSGMQEAFAPSDEADIVLGDGTAAGTAPAQTERGGTATTAAKTQSRQERDAIQTEPSAADPPEQAATAAPDSGTDEPENSGNVLPDDGLEWSPLVPVE